MRIRFGVAAAAVALAALLPARAAAQPKPDGPAVEVRLRSVNDLLDRAEYIGKLADKEEPIRQARDLVKALSQDGKGVEGVDPKKPFGAYGSLNSDVASSPAVILVPIADEARFLKMLKERLSIEPEKADGGALKINVPLINEVYARFANGYLYLARDPKHIDARGLVAPEAFFAKDDGAVASVVVRFDRLPADLKTLFLGQLEHQTLENLKKSNDGKPLVEKKAGELAANGVISAIKAVVEEGKEFKLRLVVDPKADELAAEVSLTAQDGTDLAKQLAGLASKPSRSSGITASAAAAVAGGAKLDLSAEAKKKLAPLVDGLIEEIVKQAKPGEQEFARKALETLAPTLKSGALDASAALVGPGPKGKYALLVALDVKEGAEIEQLLRNVAPLVPEADVKFTFDVEKVGGYTLHKIVPGHSDAGIEKVFGAPTIWLATSNDSFALSIEPDGALLKAGLKAKPASGPVATVGVSLSRVLPLAQPNLKPDELKALIQDAFGGESPSGKDAISLSVNGGKQLTLKVSMKGKAVRLAAAMDQLKAK